MLIFSKIKKFLKNLSYPYGVFGLFGVITYPLFYWLWTFNPGVGYDNLSMRLITAFLCLLLIFEHKWPASLRKYLKWYWYITITYSLPFLFTFFLFKSQFNFLSILNYFAIMVLAILLVRTRVLYIITPIGGILGWILFLLTTENTTLPNLDYESIILTFLSVILFGAIFAYRHDKSYDERIKLLRNFSKDLAHELRTPLSSVQLQTESLKSILPIIIDGYHKANEHNLVDKKINVKQEKHLPNIVNSITDEMNFISLFINNLLVSLSPIQEKAEHELCSIKSCIDEAIERYPFQENQTDKIELHIKHDFSFYGKEVLMIHVLFNLLKNSLYYIADSKKPNAKIILSTKATKNSNLMIFKDTGIGIPSDKLDHVFERFYSNTIHGTGIGLSFCKQVVESFDGTIWCESEIDVHTTFIISLPKIKELSND